MNAKLNKSITTKSPLAEVIPTADQNQIEFAQEIFDNIDGRYDSKIITKVEPGDDIEWTSISSAWTDDPREAANEVMEKFNAYASGKGGVLLWRLLPAMYAREGKIQIRTVLSISNLGKAIEVKEEADEKLASLKDMSVGPLTRRSKERKCPTCTFWDRKSAEHNVGLCRKNPPAFWPETPLQRWAYTAETDWCGAYEVKP